MTATLMMPRLGETMEDGVVTAWLVQPGHPFQRGDALVEVETDKMAVEFPALGPGTLVKVLVDLGERVLVGAPIALIDLHGGEDWTREEGLSEFTTASTSPSLAKSADAADAAVTLVNATLTLTTDTSSFHTADAGPIRATPPARRAAAAAGLDLAAFPGTGRRGRIELGDVLAHGTQAVTFAGDIAYTVSGPATGSPILLLHGFGADRMAWAALSAGLARSGKRVFAADLPGHGRTRAEVPNTAALGTGLGPLIAAAGGRPEVVAHSLGAAVALTLAGEDLAASLTLIAPAGIGLSIDATFIRGLAAPGSAGEVAHLLRRLSDRPLALSAAALQHLFADLSRGRLTALADAVLGPSGQMLDLVPAINAAARRMPVRVIIGHRDRITDWHDVLNLSSRVAIHHLPMAGHMPHWDAPAEILEILGAFA